MVPALAVQARGMTTMFSNIVIGLKEDLPHEQLFALAKKVAGQQARIHLLSYVKAGTYEDEPARLKKMERSLDGRAETLRNDGFEVTREVGLIAVAAAAELLRYASEHGADLLVVGLAKRTRVGKAFMGSDAQRVLLGSECPVLVTRLVD